MATESRHNVAPLRTASPAATKNSSRWSRRSLQNRSAAAGSMRSPPRLSHGGAHRGFGAGELHHQHAVPPRAGAQRQRQRGPLLQLLQRARLGPLETQRGACRRQRQHLQRDFDDRTEDAQRPREHAGDVVAGHVLHHLATEAQQFAPARRAGRRRARSRARCRPRRGTGRTDRRPPCRPRCLPGHPRCESAAARRPDTGPARRARLPVRPAGCRRAR